MGDNPLRMNTIAVIIPTFNSARTLSRCLESIRSQTLPPGEVMIVDDERTSDTTRQIAEAFSTRVIVSAAGMAESRNIGIETCTGPFLLSVDSDMILHPYLLRELLRCWEQGVEAMSIRERALITNFWSRGRALDKTAVERTGHGRAIRAFTRQLFRRIGGYDASLEAGEDIDFHHRALDAGARIKHLDQVSIIHDEGFPTLLSAARKKLRYGRSLRPFEEKHGSLLLAGMGDRLRVGVALGLRDDPAAVLAFLSLKAAEGIGALIGRAVPLKQ
jgi:glycosyltransferase involved in cell wall biosynthesis